MADPFEGFSRMSSTPQCHAFVVERLDGTQLSHALAGRLKALSACYSIARAGAVMTDFENGGIYEEAAALTHVGGSVRQVVNDDDVLADALVSFLGASSGNYGLFENPIARVGDPFLRTRSSSLKYYGQNVFHWLGPFSEAGSVRTMIAEWKVLPAVLGIVGRSQPKWLQQVSSKQHLEVEDLDIAGESAQYVIASAFDGESYVICKLE